MVCLFIVWCFSMSSIVGCDKASVVRCIFSTFSNVDGCLFFILLFITVSGSLFRLGLIILCCGALL